MAAKREYKQRCDNPAILSAMKASLCEMSMQRDSNWSPSSIYSRNAGAVGLVPSHPETNTAGSSICNSLASQVAAKYYVFLTLCSTFVVSDIQSCDVIKRHLTFPARSCEMISEEKSFFLLNYLPTKAVMLLFSITADTGGLGLGVGVAVLVMAVEVSAA